MAAGFNAGGAPPGADNHHATGIVLDSLGILITGPSGSGKSTLALALVAYWRLSGRFARLVADDQVYLSGRAGRLVAYAPQQIAGLAEAHGFGPVWTPHEPAAVIDLVVELAEREVIQRMPATITQRFAGQDVPLLLVPCRSVIAALTTLTAAIGGVPFASAGRNGAIMLAEAHDLGLSTGS